MLKTTSGEHSLLLWEQNRNGLSYYQSFGDTSLDDFIKNKVVEFFTSLEERTSHYFADAWTYTVKRFRASLAAELQETFLKGYTFEDVLKVVNKVVGNIGEIFAEYFLTHYGEDWIDIDKDDYTPIDPTQEDYTDAKATGQDGLTVFFQVKNWTGEIDSKTFWKAGFEAYLNAKRNLDKAVELLSKPHFYIFSFTEEKFSFRQKDFAEVVGFIGPKDLNRLIRGEEVRSNICKKIIKQIA